MGLFSMAGLLLPLVVAASASAQGANLQVTPQVASPGQVVTVTGSGYSETGGALSNASIRLSTRNGLELKSEPVDTSGRITASFPVPNVSPGWCLLIATRIVEANGRQKSFTPGRTRLRVVAAAKDSASAAAGGSGAGGWPGGPGWLTAGAVALVLLAAGSTPAARRRLDPQPTAARQLAGARQCSVRAG